MLLEAGEQLHSNEILQAIVENMEAFVYEDADQDLLLEKCINLVHNGCILQGILNILLKLQNQYSLIPCYDQLSEEQLNRFVDYYVNNLVSNDPCV